MTRFVGPALDLLDVKKHFGGLPAVDGVTLDVEQGSIFAIIGPNGAGKSTLLKCICGMHRATSGRIAVSGQDVTSLPVHALRQHGIAQVRQTPRPLPSMSTRENVVVDAMFGAPAGRRAEPDALVAADEALALVGLADKADWPVGRLTLHEQRMLGLASALAGDPRLLLLDEVMAGLNPTELASALDVIRRIRDEQGVTIIWVEHVMRAVMALAEEVAVLNFGRLLARGTPREVMNDEQVVSAYLGSRPPGDA